MDGTIAIWLRFVAERRMARKEESTVMILYLIIGKS